MSKYNGLFLGRIQIWNDSLSSAVIENVPKSDVSIFINKVNEQIDNYRNFSVEINQNIEKDITDKIKKLGELHKEKVLTDYEFSMKKMELLDKFKK